MDYGPVIPVYLYIDGGILKSKVVFYNFVLGKDNGKRIVGSFYPEALGEGMMEMGFPSAWSFL